MNVLQRAIRGYKEKHELTYKELGLLWGMSGDALRKMGCGERKNIGVRAALRIEKLTRGEISATDLVLGARRRRA